MHPHAGLALLLLTACGPMDRVEGDPETECDDRLDNDGDGRWDCADPGCFDVPPCNDGRDSAAPGGPTDADNRPPIAHAGDDVLAILPGTELLLDGSRSSDPDGDLLSWRWSVSARPNGSWAEITRVEGPRATFTVDEPGTFALQLEVDDGRALDQAVKRIVVDPGNRPPRAVASAGAYVYVGEVLRVDGSGSFDPDGDPITFEWRLMQAGPGTDPLLTAAPDEPTASLVPESSGRHTLQLVVRDGQLASPPVLVVVDVFKP